MKNGDVRSYVRNRNIVPGTGQLVGVPVEWIVLVQVATTAIPVDNSQQPSIFQPFSHQMSAEQIGRAS